ncbi:MAG: glycosyltransferase family 39 protein [Planctomycetota bacterium]
MRGLVGVMLVIAVGAAVYLPGLGERGFGASEGHRVVPAVEFAERDAWLLPTMFETVYIRKPPGMPIGIMLSSEAFGWTEFAARFVSAAAVILGGVVLAGFGMRWFGARFGWSAGLAYVLAPVVVATGRAAEIEALHNLFVLLSCALIVELLVRRPGKGVDRAVLGGVALGAALLGMILTKGPAAVPTVLGTLLACAMIVRMWKALASPAVWIGIAIAGGVTAWLSLELAVQLEMRSEPHVKQSPLAFSFSAGKLFAIVALPLAAFASHLPASLAMLPLLGWQDLDDRDRVARACARGWLLSILIFMAFGVSNNRYALPSVGLACLCVPWALHATAHRFSGLRRLGSTLAVLGSPKIIFVLLLSAAFARNWLVERREAIKSGREPGIALAEALMQATPLPIEVWADELIEARPETLLYAERRADEDGRELRGFWSASWDDQEFADGGPTLPAVSPGLARFVLLRRDESSEAGSELARFRGAGLTQRLMPVYDGGVYPDGERDGETQYRFPFTVFRVLPE